MWKMCVISQFTLNMCLKSKILFSGVNIKNSKNCSNKNYTISYKTVNKLSITVI